MSTPLLLRRASGFHFSELTEKLTGTIESQVLILINIISIQEVVVDWRGLWFVRIQLFSTILSLSVLLIPIAVAKIVFIWSLRWYIREFLVSIELISWLR